MFLRMMQQYQMGMANRHDLGAEEEEHNGDEADDGEDGEDWEDMNEGRIDGSSDDSNQSHHSR